MAGTAFSTSSWAGYDEATATNPSAALTDFTLLISISTFSATWKANIQSDGADIRCTKGDDTEIPFDLIDFAYNAGAPTGKIRCKWSGSLASSGTQNVRVWAGYLRGTAVAYGDTETYGADNAYVSGCVGYWPLSGDFNDRTSYANNGTGAGGISAGGTSGQVTNATSFDGTDDSISVVTGGLPTELQIESGTMMMWVKSSATNNFNGLAVLRANTDAGLHQAVLSELGTGSGVSVRKKAASGVLTSGAGDYTLSSTFHHYAGTFSSTATEVIEDNSSVDSDTGSVGSMTFNTTGFLSFGTFTNVWGSTGGGTIEEILFYNDIRTGAWIGEEYSQSSSQSSFWGTWAWTFATFVGSGVLDGNALSDASLVR